jgi:hypothetical protein
MLDTRVGIVSVKCPHCGYDNRISVEVGELGRLNVYYCNIDEGGCDEPFVWKPSVGDIAVEVFTVTPATNPQLTT